ALGSVMPNWNYPSPQWVTKAERFVALDSKLPKVVSGEAQPADAAERLALAKLCQEPYKQLYRASARLYRDAFASEPKLSEDVGTGNRYNAACTAALAGCGQGKDGATLETEERHRLRGQALAWLRDDLSAWRLLLETEPNQAASVIKRMQDSQQDPDF